MTRRRREAIAAKRAGRWGEPFSSAGMRGARKEAEAGAPDWESIFRRRDDKAPSDLPDWDDERTGT